MIGRNEDPEVWIGILGHVNGSMTTDWAKGIRWRIQNNNRRVELVFRGLVELRLRPSVLELVRFYYENYTDATELEHDEVERLTRLLNECDVDEDVALEAIREAEQLINAGGGAEAEDGSRHLVRTPEAWADVEEEVSDGAHD